MSLNAFDASTLNCPECLLNHPLCETHGGDSLTAPAELLARELLSLIPNRLAHTLQTGVRCEELALISLRRLGLSPRLAELAHAVGTLHDIGYAPLIRSQSWATGQHSVDGARFLQALGAPPVITRQVARHSTSTSDCAIAEVPMDEWPPVNDWLSDVLWVADFTTSHDGHLASPAERIEGIRARYPDERLVSIENSMEDFLAALDRLGVPFGTPIEPGKAA